MDDLETALCGAGNHFVGVIANHAIRHTDWEAAVRGFARTVDDFNVRGQREEIPHPGWCVRGNFCPECGASLASLELLTFGQALDAIERARAAGPLALLDALSDRPMRTGPALPSKTVRGPAAHR